ncbi:nitroreductase [Lentilitoribacter sp. Alg239-R112]|uniref:nitroreductase n=1 Tax=Lentilitoribacter sp. Alg239-R112 TaxID=2305987 RepID=UPI0013A6D74B|nr:nitroreductase [Lentilitoribacter sp. Alg239-R112]
MSKTLQDHFSKLLIDRRSTRAYLERDVDEDIVSKILNIARHTQSGGNMQPWRVSVLRKKTISRLQTAIADDVSKTGFIDNGDYQYYPREHISPYSERIQQCGVDLHSALDIGRRDTAMARSQRMKNFEFFGAPVGLIITMNKSLEQGSWIDVGLFLNSLTLAISAYGLSSCVQASFSSYGDIIRNVLDLHHDKLVICGVSIGYADKEHPVNNIPQKRMAVDEFTEFYP